MIYIYGLHDSSKDVGDIRYIGQTINPKSRLSSHRNDKGGTAKAQWIRGMLYSGGTLGMIVLDTAEDSAQANAKENAWMLLAKEHGWQLTNGTNPGEHRDLYSADMAMTEYALARAQKAEVDLKKTSWQKRKYERYFRLVEYVKKLRADRAFRRDIRLSHVSAISLPLGIILHLLDLWNIRNVHDELLTVLFLIWSLCLVPVVWRMSSDVISSTLKTMRDDNRRTRRRLAQLATNLTRQ